jgi:hypothetical protein
MARLRGGAVQWLLLAALLVVRCGASYNQRAMDEANKNNGEATKKAMMLFRAAAFLEPGLTAIDSFNNLGVCLMRAANEIGADPARAVWSLAAFELSARLDPLTRAPRTDENLALLMRQEPDVAELLKGRPRGYWKPGPLLPTNVVGEVALAHAHGGREDEALLFLWQVT